MTSVNVILQARLQSLRRMIEWRRGSHVHPVEIFKRPAGLFLLTLVDSEAIGQSSGRGSAHMITEREQEGR